MSLTIGAVNTDDDGDVVTVALGVLAGFEASACCIQHIKNNTNFRR